MTLYDFNTDSKANDWLVVDDVVMGGRSDGNFYVDENGYGIFEGNISLENNGGFSSVRYECSTIAVHDYSKIRLHVKGDGNTYQLRIKSNRNDYYSYAAYFQSDNNWGTIDIPLKAFYTVFRGRDLDMPNFNGETIEEIGILIGNKKAQTFKLVLDKIELIK
ncbi:CIA30 family protein [Hanstruepera ponticola]|uniref:CIA30 family protein n=1 Tax=Hanstruepera ponticola TaxID=2042995 RepID=UPI000CF039E7|nr:CIA30 family protein [Hanstruepera ponticola]